MALSGKETTMRRGAYLLALLGMTVQTANASDLFGAGRAQTGAQPPAATTPAGKAAASPQKFTRSPAAQPNEELRNYYKELFGDLPPEEATPGAAAGASGLKPALAKPSTPPVAVPKSAAPESAPATSSLRPASPTFDSNSFAKPAPTSPTSFSASGGVASGSKVVLGTNAPDDSKVVHAQFQDDSTKSEGKIQQVHEERFSARPFPGAAGAPAEAHDDFSSFDMKKEKGSPFSKPATTTFGPRETTPPVATAAPSTPGGSVTFSRTATPASSSRATVPVSKPDAAVSAVTQSPAISIEWRKQSDLNVGQECQCHLIVKNDGQTAAKEMEIQAFFPENVRLVGAKPAPAVSDRYLGWNVDELKPGEERTIEITMIPLQRGDINTRAEVRFSGVANGRFAVAEPMLDVTLEGPAQVLIGESAAQIVTVSNPGTGIASHVQIEAVVPEGLEHTRGQRLQMDLGNLNPGESRSVRLALAAAKGGQHRLTVNARADSGLVRSTSTDVMVIAPSLTTTIQGPGLRYLGRQASYVLTVANSGEAPTDNVQLRYKVPAGFDFVSADRGAQYDSATGLVTCFIGRMDKGQKEEVKITLLARQSGEFKHLARASSEHGAISDAEFTTSVEATSSLAVQVKDLEDPVEVGSETVYEIRVRNEGTAAAKGVDLVCELADGMMLVNAEGPTRHRVEGNTVIFQQIPEVGAGQTSLFKVKVKAAAPGSLRFRALLSSESVSEPLTVEEMTKFYGE